MAIDQTLWDQAAVEETHYGSKGVKYRNPADLIRLYLAMGGTLPGQLPGGAGAPGTGRYKLATVRSRGYRAPGSTCRTDCFTRAHCHDPEP